MPAFVQSKKNSTTGATSLAVTLDSSVTAGDLIVVVFSTFGSVTHSTVTDSLGNTYTKAVDSGLFASTRLSVWYAFNVTGGSCTVTCTPSASAFITIAALEYSGVKTSVDPLDATGSGTGFSSSPSSGSQATSEDHELLFGALAHGSGNFTITAGAGWTLREHEDNGSVFEAMGSEDQLDAAAGSYAATFSLSSSANWAVAIVTFEGASANITPAAGALSADGQQAQTNNPAITPGVGSLPAVGAQATVELGKFASAGQLSANGQSPFVLYTSETDISVTPDAGSLSASGQTPSAPQTTVLTPDAGELLGVGRGFFTFIGLVVELYILTADGAPLIVQFDIIAPEGGLEPLVVELDVVDFIDAGLNVTLDILPSPLTSPDVQAPVAQVTLT